MTKHTLESPPCSVASAAGGARIELLLRSIPHTSMALELPSSQSSLLSRRRVSNPRRNKAAIGSSSWRWWWRQWPLALVLFLPPMILDTTLRTTVTALDNGVALTPPMGWLSWERFGCNLDCQNHPDSCISERLYLEQAQELVVGGYRDEGYVYVNIDDCWSEKQRDIVTGHLVPDRIRFPRGMKHLSHQLHRIGLKLGLYGDIGTMTCAGYPGMDGHWDQDAQQLADWEIDSIKVDGCHSDQTMFNVTYPAFGRALNKTGRPILYNCQWPLYQSQSHHGEDFDLLSTQIAHTCNQWRNYYDVFDSWVSIRSIVDYWSRTHDQDVLVKAAGPGHWNDPDMLVVGNPGLSLSEQQAQFALWAIFAAPLLLSADLRTMPSDSRRILLNAQVIAVNQDPLGHQGYCPEGCNPPSPHRIYVRELSPEPTSNGSSSSSGVPVGSSNRWAVVLANFDAIFATIPITFDPTKHLPPTNPYAWMDDGGYAVQDILEHHDCGVHHGPFTADVDESSVRMFVVVARETTPTDQGASQTSVS